MLHIRNSVTFIFIITLSSGKSSYLTATLDLIFISFSMKSPYLAHRSKLLLSLTNLPLIIKKVKEKEDQSLFSVWVPHGLPQGPSHSHLLLACLVAIT